MFRRVHHQRRHYRLITCLALCLGLLAAACGTDSEPNGGAAATTTGPASSEQPGSDATDSPTGSFIYATQPDVATFDPHAAQAGQQFSSYLTLVYDGLVLLDKDFGIQPLLAESWEYLEPTRLEFILREGVTFSDGAVFDAEAAQANIERVIEIGGPRAVLFRNIESVEATGPNSMVINLSRPDATLLRSLASSPGLMVSPDAFENEDLDRNPVGTGPFLLNVQRSTFGTEYVFEAREDYHSPQWQRVAEVSIKPIASSTARVNALRSGEVDAALIGSTDADAAKAAGLELMTAGNRFDGMTIIDRNGELVPAFTDSRVRTALGFAIDRQALADAVYLGYADPAYQPFAPGELGHVEELNGFYEYDPGRARELLAEAGYADGFSFTYPTEEGGSTLATAIQGFLADVGIDMQIELQETGSLGQVGRTKNYPVITIGYPARDPDSRSQAIWSSSAAFNPFGIDAGELDELAALASASTDDAERDDLFGQYSRIVVEEGYTVVLLNPLDIVAHRSELSGVTTSSFYDPMLRLISIDS